MDNAKSPITINEMLKQMADINSQNPNFDLVKNKVKEIMTIKNRTSSARIVRQAKEENSNSEFNTACRELYDILKDIVHIEEEISIVSIFRDIAVPVNRRFSLI